MGNQLSKQIFSVFLMLLISGYAFSQNPGKVKAVMSDLPKSMAAGEIYKVAVNITNTGNTEWSSEHLHGKADGKFEISKEWSGEWKLQPGETTQVYYKITAPGTSGKYMLKITIYNDNKKIAKGYRKVIVADPNSPGNK